MSRVRNRAATAGIVLAALLAALLCAPARAQQPKGDIEHVIAAQIDAFRDDDGTAALSFAVPALQHRFVDGAHFLAMVRDAYPAVYRPSRVSFGRLSPADGGMRQAVELVGPQGDVVVATYDMQRQPDGGWRIAGCSTISAAQLEL